MSRGGAEILSRTGANWSFLGVWVISEIAAWILMSLVGPEGSAWLLAVSLAIGILFLMVYATIRVLRGHDL